MYIPRALNKGTYIVYNDELGGLFILQAYTGTGVSHSQHRKKPGEVLEKNAGEWAGRVENGYEEIPGSQRGMYGYILTNSRL